MTVDIAIVGAGVGGLATAARLSSKGHKVEVFEKMSECGGRAHVIKDKNFLFDTGPSFVLMPPFFEEVFSYSGQKLNEYLDLKALDVHYVIFYPDGTKLTIYKDIERTKQELETFEPKAGHKLDDFIKETGRIYKIVENLLYKCLSKKDLLNPQYLKYIFKLDAFISCFELASRFFKNEKLRYAFTFEAMFLGVSPFKAPGFYSVISYADQVQKITHPIGGMYQIPLALEKIAAKFQTKLHYKSEVKKILPNGNKFILELTDKQIEAKRVIVNADYVHAQKQLLKRSVPDYEYSCSVFLMYLGLKKKVQGLAHHNIFFASDLRKNLGEIFNNSIISKDASFYIHVPTVTDPGLAPDGKDILYFLMPVPNFKHKTYEKEEYVAKLRSYMLQKANEVTGEHIEDLIEVEHHFYPHDFINRYNIDNAATFGLSHTLFQSAFFRPSNMDRLKDLYYVGASTQPGGGLPVVLAGSRIVADLIEKNI